MLLGARQFFEKRGGGWRNPYVTDGLVAMWDGEWNAGGGVHDSTATTWKDLVGDNDLESFGTGVSTGDKYGAFESSASASRGGFLGSALPPVQAFQIVAQMDANKGCALLNSNRNCFAVFSNTTFLWTGTRQSNDIDYMTTLRRFAYSANFVSDTSYTMDAAWDGISSLVINSSRYINFGATDRLVVGGPTTSADSYFNQYSFVGKIYRIGFYSRALTAAEIATNYAIDKARFNLP